MTTFGRVSLDLPDEYDVKMLIVTAPQKKGGGAKRFVQSERSYVRNVVVGAEAVPKGVPLPDYVDRQQEMMAAQMPGFAKTASSTIEIGGVACPLIEAQGQGPEGMLLQTITAYVPGDGVVYTLSATHMAGLPFSETKGEYVAIFKSFRAP